MLLLTAVLLLAGLGVLTFVVLAARRPNDAPKPSPYWLDAIEGARHSPHRPT
jgi:hypothetical protein